MKNSQIYRLYLLMQKLVFFCCYTFFLIVAADFHVRIVLSKQTTRQVLRKLRQSHICKYGQRLVNHALINHLVITNTIDQQNPSHLLTSHSSDGATKARIDFMLVRQRWKRSLQAPLSCNGTGTSSYSGYDHWLVAAKILFGGKKKLGKSPL